MQVLERHHVTVSGVPEGPVLLFAHGFGCDQRMWRHVAPAFEDTHRVVLFDHAGAGRSWPSAFDPDRHADLRGYADDLIVLCEELDLRHVVIVGHSVGAIIGVLATIRSPERFDGLVLVGPSPRYLDDEGYTGGFSRADIDELLETMDRNYLGWSRGMAELVAGEPGSPTAAELDNSFCRTDPQIAQHLARTTFLADNRNDLADVPVRCLVLQVSNDAIAPIEVGEYVAARLPDSRMVVIDGVGHCPQLTNPTATVAAMRAFLGTAAEP